MTVDREWEIREWVWQLRETGQRLSMNPVLTKALDIIEECLQTQEE